LTDIHHQGFAGERAEAALTGHIQAVAALAIPKIETRSPRAAHRHADDARPPHADHPFRRGHHRGGRTRSPSNKADLRALFPSFSVTQRAHGGGSGAS